MIIEKMITDRRHEKELGLDMARLMSMKARRHT
jgi:hypothetical protein